MNFSGFPIQTMWTQRPWKSGRFWRICVAVPDFIGTGSTATHKDSCVGTQKLIPPFHIPDSVFLLCYSASIFGQLKKLRPADDRTE
jgi:hypothetical protein